MVKIQYLYLQEVWCIRPYANFVLSGYHPLFFYVRDPSGHDQNAGGGVALWCDSDYPCTLIKDISIFEPGVIESAFVKIEVTTRKFTLVGNIYRPNLAPLADKHAFNTKILWILE